MHKQLNRTNQVPKQALLSLGFLIVFAGFTVRLLNLLELPLFIDEIFHLNRAHAIALGNPFAGLEHDKWLYTVLLGVFFRPLGPEGPFIARYLTVVLSAITIAACIRLGTELQDRLAGLLAGVVYTFIPMAVFIERQALVDGTLAAFSTMSLLVTVWLVRKPRLIWAVLLSFLLTAAYLTKGTGFPFLIVPIFAVLLLSPTRRNLIKGGLMSAAAIAVAVGIKTIIWNLAARQAEFEGVLDTHNVTSAAFSDLPRLLSVSYLSSRLSPYVSILSTYVGWLLVFLALSALIWIVRQRNARALLFILIPSIGLGVATALADSPSLSNRVEVRYLTPTVAPLVLLAMIAASLSITQFKRIQRFYVSFGLVFAILIPYLSFNSQLIQAPLAAPLRPEDQQAYRDAALEAKRTVSETIMERETLGTELRIVGPFDCCQPYMGPRWAAYTDLTLDDRALPNQISEWVRAGQTVYIVENTAFFVLPDHQLGAQLELVEEAPMPLGQLNLYQVEGIHASCQEALSLYDFVAPAPGQLPEAERDLLTLLDSSDEALLVHPAGFAPYLEEQTGRSATAMTPTSWPMSRSDAARIVEQDIPGEEFSRVDAVLVDPTITDPERQLQLALDSSLFLLDNQTLGLFVFSSYVTGASQPNIETLDVVFEEAITLDQAAWSTNLDVLSIQLFWETNALIEDSFVVFVHIINDQGELVAQRDSIPGNGFYPTTSWSTDFPTEDRFAIQLPPELPAGDYEVRAGLYEPTSGLRLRVTNGEYPDYAQIAVLTIP